MRRVWMTINDQGAYCLLCVLIKRTHGPGYSPLSASQSAPKWAAVSVPKWAAEWATEWGPKWAGPWARPWAR
jgi:hypothetical protein